MKPARPFRRSALVSLALAASCSGPGARSDADAAARDAGPRAELRIEGARPEPLVLGEGGLPTSAAVAPATVLRVHGIGAAEPSVARVVLSGEVSVVCEAVGDEPRKTHSWKIDVKMEPAAGEGPAREFSAEVELDLARYAGECGGAGAVLVSGWVQALAVDAGGAEARSPAFFFHAP